MLVKVVPHSTLQPLFSTADESYEIELHKYEDIFNYLDSIHPKFYRWAKTVELFDEQMPYCILDKDGEVVLPNKLKKVVEDKNEVLYIVPVISGGGGRVGKVIAGAVLIAAAVYTGGLSLGASGFTWAATGGSLWVAKAAFNIGIALVASAFIREPEQPEQTQTIDQASRRSNQFGPLKGTEGQGTYLQEAFGEVRVVGHRLSAHADPHKHGTEDTLVLPDIYPIPRNTSTKNSGVV